MKKIGLGDHFTYRKLIRFALPSVVMMIVTSLYTVVDGYFVSNFVGKNPFAALNLIWPYLQLINAAGFMIGSGGSALVAFTLGEGKEERANQIFSMLIRLMVYFAIFLSVVSVIFMRPIALALGAGELLVDDCVTYGRVMASANAFMMLQAAHQSFLVTAEKPKMGLGIAVFAGLTNVVCDFVFVYFLRWGLWGAAFASAMSQVAGGMIPTIYFLRKNNSRLQLVWAKMDFRAIGKACANGASEMMTNLSGAVIGLLYNFQLLKYAGENGVAAYGAILYIAFIFQALFFGYAMSSTPIVGYHYGAGNQKELKNVLKKSLTLTAIVGVCMTAFAEGTAGVIARVFVGYDAQLCQITITGMRFFAISFLMGGFNVFASAFFTGLNNGKISALISFLRTLVIQVLAIYLLPLFFKLNGIWMAAAVAEGVTILVSMGILSAKREEYGY